MCLYCNDRRHPFNSLEAVRKHMVAKSHCKVHYGDDDDEEEAELEEFYDYSSRFCPSHTLRLFNSVYGYLVTLICSRYYFASIHVGMS